MPDAVLASALTRCTRMRSSSGARALTDLRVVDYITQEKYKNQFGFPPLPVIRGKRKGIRIALQRKRKEKEKKKETKGKKMMREIGL